VNQLTRRLFFLALALNLATSATAAYAQQPKGIPVVGVLVVAAGQDDPIVLALRQGMRELGYVEGRNIRIEVRTAQSMDRLPSLAEELVQLKVDVIVVTSTLTAQAAKRTTSTIPVVMTLVADPIGSGFVTNLAHPGGNVTGLSLMTTELNVKRLELLKETMPKLARVAVLSNPNMPYVPKTIEELKAAARSMSIELSIATARTPEEFEAAFRTIRRARAQALYLIESPLFYGHRTTLAKLVVRARLPAIYGTRAFADEGGLMSYGASYEDLMRRCAGYVDKILRGAKPGDLPIEQPTKFEFVVNLRTAQALGLSIPQAVFLQADDVIK